MNLHMMENGMHKTKEMGGEYRFGLMNTMDKERYTKDTGKMENKMVKVALFI